MLTRILSCPFLISHNVQQAHFLSLSLWIISAFQRKEMRDGYQQDSVSKRIVDG